MKLNVLCTQFNDIHPLLKESNSVGFCKLIFSMPISARIEEEIKPKAKTNLFIFIKIYSFS